MRQDACFEPGYLVDSYLGGGYRNKFTDVDKMLSVCQAMCQEPYINYFT